MLKVIKEKKIPSTKLHLEVTDLDDKLVFTLSMPKSNTPIRKGNTRAFYIKI